MPKEKDPKNKQRSTKHTCTTKDRVTRTPLKTGSELRCSGRVSSYFSTSDTRRVNLVTNTDYGLKTNRASFTTISHTCINKLDVYVIVSLFKIIKLFIAWSAEIKLVSGITIVWGNAEDNSWYRGDNESVITRISSLQVFYYTEQLCN
jgi:hypothetical protein